jgi:hypothetical protein
MSTPLTGNERGGHRLHRNTTIVNYSGPTAALRRTQRLPDHRAEIAVVAGRPPFRPLADRPVRPYRCPPRSSRLAPVCAEQLRRRSSAGARLGTGLRHSCGEARCRDSVSSCQMACAGRVKVKAIRWVGVETDRVSEMRSFATDVLGLRLVEQDGEDFVELAMADGAKLELFASQTVAQEPSVFASNPVIARLLVDNLEQARDELSRTPGV